MKKPFDAAAIQATIQRALASAGLDTSSGPMQEATETIRRALAGGTGAQASTRFDPQTVIDVEARELAADCHETANRSKQKPAPDPGVQGPGSFMTHRFSNAAGSRGYKLYLPAGQTSAPCAMVVMLHGCTQSADDFAAGTQMNRLADEHGFLVVYPEQSVQANASKCWNWFKPEDQSHGRGEPAVIVGIVHEVAQRHGVDSQRIFVAGLSAGAAMAVVLGETYPGVFAAVGAHSGLAYGSAHDVQSALAAMKGKAAGHPGWHTLSVAAARVDQQAMQAVPIIVFHGDRDRTVRQTNGAQIVQQAAEAHAALHEGEALRVTTFTGVAAGGRPFTRTVYENREGRPCIESWTLQAGGHAWSGGHASGTYTDATGPDASAEMVRFFLAQQQTSEPS